MCPTKKLLKSFLDSNTPWTSTCVLFIILLNERWNFSKICWTHGHLGSRPELVRNHFLVSLLKKQQVYIVQPLGHFLWSLKSQSLDYNQLYSRILFLNYLLLQILFSHKPISYFYLQNCRLRKLLKLYVIYG